MLVVKCEYIILNTHECVCVQQMGKSFLQTYSALTHNENIGSLRVKSFVKMLNKNRCWVFERESQM